MDVFVFDLTKHIRNVAAIVRLINYVNRLIQKPSGSINHDDYSVIKMAMNSFRVFFLLIVCVLAVAYGE